jgi:hypothetical protein
MSQNISILLCQIAKSGKFWQKLKPFWSGFGNPDQQSGQFLSSPTAC